MGFRHSRSDEADAQTLTAPSDIAVTAPSCVTGSCPDVDHTRDLLVTCENGGAGKVDVLFETVADSNVVLVECKFDAQAGKAVVPASLLAKLDVVDLDNVSASSKSVQSTRRRS